MANAKIGQPIAKTVEMAGAKDPLANTQPLLVDSSGNLLVSGTFSATNPSIGVNGATAPTSSTEVGGINPSGNLNPLHTDASNNLLVNVSNFPATQPVSGTVAISQTTPGTTNGVVVNSSALPTGASTSASQTTGNTSLASIDTKVPALGQALAAASVPVVLTAAQITTLTPLSSVTVTQATGTNLHTVVDSSALPTGASTSANQTTSNTSLASIVTNTGNIPAKGSATSANSTPVVIASDQAAVPISAPASATATLTNVAASASSVSLLALNTARKQAAVYNDSTAILYLKLGTTASVTSYTVQLPANGYYELPGISVYTGAIQGIWASATGNARITELS